MSLELHPLCTLFPRMSDVDFSALKEDIRANGQDEPITLHDGMILDGGHRYRACIEVGLEPKVVKYNGLDPVAYVLTKNLLRRHLSTGQRAAIVALAADWGKAEKHGGDRKSDQGATLPLDSVQDRAARSDAGERTQKDADKVAREAPNLAQKVASGEMTLPQAVKRVRPKPAAPRASKTDTLQARVAELQAENAVLVERIAEVAQGAEEAIADNASMAAAFESDDKLVQLLAENKRLRAEIVIARQRINGLMNEKNEAVRAAKSWQRKYEKLKGGA